MLMMPWAPLMCACLVNVAPFKKKILAKKLKWCWFSMSCTPCDEHFVKFAIFISTWDNLLIVMNYPFSMCHLSFLHFLFFFFPFFFSSHVCDRVWCVWLHLLGFVYLYCWCIWLVSCIHIDNAFDWCLCSYWWYIWLVLCIYSDVYVHIHRIVDCKNCCSARGEICSEENKILVKELKILTTLISMAHLHWFVCLHLCLTLPWPGVSRCLCDKTALCNIFFLKQTDFLFPWINACFLSCSFCKYISQRWTKNKIKKTNKRP